MATECQGRIKRTERYLIGQKKNKRPKEVERTNEENISSRLLRPVALRYTNANDLSPPNVQVVVIERFEELKQDVYRIFKRNLLSFACLMDFPI